MYGHIFQNEDEAQDALNYYDLEYRDKFAVFTINEEHDFSFDIKPVTSVKANRQTIMGILEWLADGGDKSLYHAHILADMCLLGIIDDPKVTELFTSIGKYYS